LDHEQPHGRRIGATLDGDPRTAGRADDRDVRPGRDGEGRLTQAVVAVDREGDDAGTVSGILAGQSGANWIVAPPSWFASMIASRRVTVVVGDEST
jgi:hypothetical protein